MFVPRRVFFAIALAQTHRLPGMHGMNNRRFWQHDLQPRASASDTRASAQRLLKIVRPAIEHLQACKRDAAVNGELLDYFLLGARRPVPFRSPTDVGPNASR